MNRIEREIAATEARRIPTPEPPAPVPSQEIRAAWQELKDALAPLKRKIQDAEYALDELKGEAKQLQSAIDDLANAADNLVGTLEEFEPK